jgi:putative cardiolipin synthase
MLAVHAGCSRHGPSKLRKFALVLALLLTACASAPPPRPALEPASAFAPAASTTQLDQRTQAALAAHPGQSGFRLIFDGVEAFALRAMSARAAGRSLDVQYFIWHDDRTGRLLINELVSAADRGVRVRLLLDDMDARAKNFALAGLDAHPNIEVRLFNPYGSREGTAGKLVESAGNLKRINRRMHNKSWIADNQVALVGGRNIGDEYFAASGAVNFFDLDFLMAGPAVQELSRSFDEYWNAPASYPMATLSPELATKQSLDALLARSAEVLAQDLQSPYVLALKESAPVARILEGTAALHWASHWQVLVDDPMKAFRDDGQPANSRVLDALRAAMVESTREITLISPYFVPGKEGSSRLVAQRQSGKAVSILTNSLAATDVAAVHGGYSRYRKTLLDGGVELFELKPGAGGDVDKSWFGSSGASLHTKAALFDRKQLFVGSFNIDPRSVSLNCEQGVLVDSPELGRQLQDKYEAATGGNFAWRIGRDARGGLTWTDDSGTLDSEPRASFSRRLQFWLLRVLPLESQL